MNSVLFLALALLFSPTPNNSAVNGVVEPKTEKLNGYAEWRKEDLLIVEGQRIRVDERTRFKGEKGAKSPSRIPLGYEVKVEGVRQPDGVILASEMEAKPNGNALFEGEVISLTNQLESSWLKEGKVMQSLTSGGSQDIGKILSAGQEVDRVKGIFVRLIPPYRKASDFRTYVVKNDDWNAFACANGMIVVHESLLHDMSDDEVAIVLGHELVHATHEHTRKQFKRALWAQLLAFGAVAAAESLDENRKKTKSIVELAALLGTMAWQNAYGRDQEDQADRVGLRYAYEGGFDVRQAPRLWKRFADKYGNSNRVVNFFFGDHSLPKARAANLAQEIALNYSAIPR
jgi:beta-barrel assembly-enhancing protease